jgi:GH18 family chitinase
MAKKILGVFALLALIFIPLTVYQLWQINLPLVSPIDLIESLRELTPTYRPPGNKIVFGFLPFWNMKDSTKLHVRSLTHLAYFGIDLTADGAVKKYDKPGEKEPGWNKLNSGDFTILSRQIKLLGKKLILVIRAMDTDQIESLLNSDANRENAIDTVMRVVRDKQFDGINIDFEYMGYPNQTTRDNFTKFVTDLSQRCKLVSVNCELSLDVFADSAIKARLYDLSKLAKVVDQVIVMAYDFYRPSSLQAGPVAPLRGKCTLENWQLKTDNCLDYDVITSIGDITKLVPPDKVILGIPFYGYEWQTVDTQFLARTYLQTGQTATYKRVRELLDNSSESSLSATWSGTTFTPYLSYSKDGNTYQIHYEDENSLKLKIEFVHQAKLAGLAIWALGYELPYTNLWLTIDNSL